MRPQLNRLDATTSGNFAGSVIDRNRPLQFRLNGRAISGFEGDTVLSAALAAGIDILGNGRAYPVGLTPGACPAIRLAGSPDQALPMARTPATDGAEFTTLDAHRPNLLKRLFQPGRTLGLQLDAQYRPDTPWRALAGAPSGSRDLIVIGGGVAGMEAALVAARAGLRVCLVEADAQLGGNSGLFGTQDGEDAPEVELSRLRSAIEAEAGIEVLTSSHAYALRTGIVRIYRIGQAGGSPKGEVLDLHARYTIIATGSWERLPIFRGNRLPGVMTTLDAYRLAHRYGVWPGRTAVFATGSNVAYRLAMLASDAGIGVTRILDGRPHSSSRFIEFSRAYGIIQMPGTAIDMVHTAKTGNQLAAFTSQAGADAILADRILVCGGWQPDLALWHMAGGSSGWNGETRRLEALGSLENIELAGSAAGYLTRRGCLESARDAVDALLGRARKPVADPVIDPIYETPDAPMPIGQPGTDAAPAFLDSNSPLVHAPASSHKPWQSWFRLSSGTEANPASAFRQAMTTNEVAAAVETGLVPPALAGEVARDYAARIHIQPSTETAAPSRIDQVPQDHVPAYLHGRFGPEAALMRIIPLEPRRLESGALVYPNADLNQPQEAIGVVLRAVEDTHIALVASESAGTARTPWVRDQDRAIACRLEDWR